MRFILVWVVAIRFPKTMLRMASISKGSCHSIDRGKRMVWSIRVARANAATFGTTDEEATTGVGESESEGVLPAPSLSEPRVKLSTHTAPGSRSPYK